MQLAEQKASQVVEQAWLLGLCRKSVLGAVLFAPLLNGALNPCHLPYPYSAWMVGKVDVVRIPVRPSSSPSGLNWEQAKVCSVGCPALHQPFMCWSKATVPPAGYRPCCSLWPICSHRLFDYRGRLSPVPVPRAVPVKRPRVTVPLVRRVKTTIPVKLFARSTAITTGTAKIKCE